MWLIKFAMCLFLRRMMLGKRMVRFANAVFVVLILTYVAIDIFNLAWCAPIQDMLEVPPSSMIAQSVFLNI